jgi:zinc protease
VRPAALVVTAGIALAAVALDPGARAEEQGSGIFHPETFTLDNGMEVVVIPNRRAPVVSHQVWYRVGSADSPPGKSGLAHFVEHLMFKGTEEVPAGEFSRLVRRHGGNDNAFTGHDFTAYHQTIAREHLELVMELEADRMTNLVFPPEEVETELLVVLEERRQVVDNRPGSVFGEQLAATQYLHHPYRLPVIGWQHEIESYTREDVVAFYETWYAPNNAVLIVTGDVDAEELRPLAERHYGGIEVRPVPERARPLEPPPAAERRVVVRDPRAGEPSLARSWLAPSRTTDEGDLSYALEVLADLLGRGSTSRLYRSLVVEQGLATSASAFYGGGGLDGTTFRVFTSPRQEVAVEALEAALHEELRRLQEEGVGEEEVERSIQRMRAEVVYAIDSLGAAARIFGMALTTGRSVEDVEAWPERIGAVTAADVLAAARQVLRPEGAVTGILLPEDPGPS